MNNFEEENQDNHNEGNQYGEDCIEEKIFFLIN